MTLRSCLRTLALVALAASFSGPSCSAPSARPAMAAQVSSRRRSVYTPRNSHLHISAGVRAGSPRGRPPPGRHPRSMTTHRRMRHRPRATATVTGTVREARGAPASGARVSLAQSNGSPLRNPQARRTAGTDGAGRYTMRSVKPGSYRVIASRSGTGRGSTGASIRSGGTHHANITLSGSRRSPRRRR